MSAPFLQPCNSVPLVARRPTRPSPQGPPDTSSLSTERGLWGDPVGSPSNLHVYLISSSQGSPEVGRSGVFMLFEGADRPGLSQGHTSRPMPEFVGSEPLGSGRGLGLLSVHHYLFPFSGPHWTGWQAGECAPCDGRTTLLFVKVPRP